MNRTGKTERLQFITYSKSIPLFELTISTSKPNKSKGGNEGILIQHIWSQGSLVWDTQIPREQKALRQHFNQSSVNQYQASVPPTAQPSFHYLLVGLLWADKYTIKSCCILLWISTSRFLPPLSMQLYFHMTCLLD